MNVPSSNDINLITAIGTIATPILLIVLSSIVWFFQRKIERSQTIEQELRDDRLQVYLEILEPFIILLTKDEAFPTENKNTVALEKILSLSYRKAAFRLSLFANDDVVRAYNDLMQFAYDSEKSPASEDEQDSQSKAWEMLNVFGNLLLEIRKSVGNEKTTLENLEMLEWMINDLRKLKEQHRK